MRMYTNYMAESAAAAQTSIDEAAHELTKAAELLTDCKPSHLAQKKIDECRWADDKAGAQFWRSVWIQLASIEYGIRNTAA